MTRTSSEKIPDHIRAAVFVDADLPLEMQEFPRPQLAAGEALVRVSCCCLCGSDLHTYTGRRSVALPTILGHEILGTIAELSAESPPTDLQGKPLAIGDRISWSVAASCGECFFCQHELPQKCERLFKYGHERCTNGHPLSGGLAEYCHLAVGTPVVKVAAEIPDAVAASANCATATVAAAMRVAGDCRGRIVVIQGAGMLGLTTAAMAAEAGAEAVIVADVNASRLEDARRFGATEVVTIDTSYEPLDTIVRNLSGGRGADVIFEMSGSASAMEHGISLLRLGGHYVLVGAVSPGTTLSVDADHLVRRMLTLQGVHNYLPADLATAIEFLRAHHNRYPFAELIGNVFSLDEADAAFQHSLNTRAIRTAVCPQLVSHTKSAIKSIPAPHWTGELQVEGGRV